MAKGTPDYQDADLALRVYEMRREPVMRSSRDLLNGKFWPATYEDVKAVATTPASEFNAPYRQVGTYWEMVYGLVKHGIVNTEFFMETNGEGMYLYAKVEPFLEQLRKEVNPTVFINAEWVAKNTDRGKMMADLFRGRVKAKLESLKK
jgi:hypothetical protein